MILKVLLLSSVCSLGYGSGIAHAPIIGGPAVVGPPPVVTAASSQYFERTFNRLVAAPPVLEPVIPVAPAPPVFSLPSTPPVIVEPVTKTVNVNPQVPESNVAFAIATAYAAAPVATILLPPYPFGLPPGLGFIPTEAPAPEQDRKEATTRSATKTQPATTREPEPTTPIPQASNNANAFAIAQGLPSNENVKFKQYYAPPLPVQKPKPQKLKTSVEIVPVPLQYIAPPPLVHRYVKPVKYVHSYVPTKIIIRPAPVKIRTVRVPIRLVIRGPISRRDSINPQNFVGLIPNTRDTEPTTFKPFNEPITKPPRL